jgi:hypothetical protein
MFQSIYYYEQDMAKSIIFLIIIIVFMNDGRLWSPYLGEKNNS